MFKPSYTTSGVSSFEEITSMSRQAFRSSPLSLSSTLHVCELWDKWGRATIREVYQHTLKNSSNHRNMGCTCMQILMLIALLYEKVQRSLYNFEASICFAYRSLLGRDATKSSTFPISSSSRRTILVFLVTPAEANMVVSMSTQSNCKECTHSGMRCKCTRNNAFDRLKYKLYNNHKTW